MSSANLTIFTCPDCDLSTYLTDMLRYQLFNNNNNNNVIIKQACPLVDSEDVACNVVFLGAFPLRVARHKMTFVLT